MFLQPYQTTLNLPKKLQECKKQKIVLSLPKPSPTHPKNV